MKKEEKEQIFKDLKEIRKCLFEIAWRLLVIFLFTFAFLAFISYQATGEFSLETMTYMGISLAIAIPIILLFLL